MVVICNTNQLDEAAAALKKCFDEVQWAYWYNKGVQSNSNLCILLLGILCNMWQTLCGALRSRTVGVEKLASDLEVKYKRKT